MNSVAGVDELLNEAFQLAFLIVGDRMTAIRIAMAAMDNLRVASYVQDKRHAYVPTGGSASRAARTKVSLSEVHILQRLVYIESEIYERLMEQQDGLLRQEDLIIHYIKHLIQVATKRNSFYVSLGLSRLLYNYTTAEATEIYNLVVQDPDRMRDDYYYRSRKGRLMDELKQRFGVLVRTYRSNRREERFHAHRESEKYANLVKQCLLRFMPWFTTCVLPGAIDPTRNIIEPLQFRGVDPDEEHSIEINRIHTLIHPECYGRLVLALGFDTPERRLEVPYFFFSSDDRGQMDQRFNPEPLTEPELNAIKSGLDSKATRRGGGLGNSLRVYVDGVERARLELARESSLKLKVDENSEVIQVRAIAADGEIVLATHLLTHADDAGLLPSKSISIAEGGQEVTFSVLISRDVQGESPIAFVKIEYKEKKLVSAARIFLYRTGYRLTNNRLVQTLQRKQLLKPALLFLAFTASIAALLFYLQLRESRIDQSSVPRQDIDSSSQPPSNQNSQEQPTVKPPTPSDQGKPSGGFIASNPKPDNSNAPRVTRGSRIKRIAAILFSVRNVYVDSLGEDSLSRQIRQTLIDRLQSSNRFTVVQNRDEAEAVFKGTARLMDRKPYSVSLRLQLVNVDGQVLWPQLTRDSRRDYLGQAEEVCDKLLKSLLDDIQKLERLR